MKLQMSSISLLGHQAMDTNTGRQLAIPCAILLEMRFQAWRTQAPIKRDQQRDKNAEAHG